MQHATEYTLGELAHAAGMTERNVRAYQAKGLLPPPLRRGRNAVYGVEHVARLRLVRALADHGLSLRVVADLIRRGTADDELARLVRENLPVVGTRSLPVPLSAANVDAFEKARPGVMDDMVAIGLMERVDGGYAASSNGLGLVSVLLTHGLTLAEVTDITLIAGRAAAATCDELQAHVEGLGCNVDPASGERHPPEDDVCRLAVQLASTAFADVLTRKLAERLRTHAES